MIETDVMIIGGGASGLTCSMLLSSYGLRSYLVSKYADTSRLPKAHLLYSKSMEMMRELGVEDAIRKQATPPENIRYVGWYAGLAGSDRDAGREIARIECWGGGGRDHQWAGASGANAANLMQAELEPLMRSRAESLAPGCVNFYHNFISLEQDETGVTSTLENRATGEVYQVRSRYLLACDGGRSVGPQVGVELEGENGIATTISVHFTADLSRWAKDSEVLLRVLVSPDVGTPVVLVPMGPDKWGPDADEWVIHLLSFPGEHKLLQDDAVIEHIKQALGLPDMQLEVRTINRWPLDGLVASRYRAGSVFILGDGAHRMSPAGGHGMNTAVQDCYNLCWKVAAVLKGVAGDALLDTYETERRPLAQYIVKRAMQNWINNGQLPRATGISPKNTPEENWRNLRPLWDEGPEGDTARRRIQDTMVAVLPTYDHLNNSYGFTYGAGALVPDGTPPPEALDPVHIYVPSTRPGASLPHAWLEDLHGRVAIGDLIARGRFALVAGEDGEAWCEAARVIAAERGIDLTAFTIGNHRADWLDLRYQWIQRQEFGRSGAVLVRPDRFVCWRADEMASDPAGQLAAAFDQILSTSKAAATANHRAMAVVGTG